MRDKKKTRIVIDGGREGGRSQNTKKSKEEMMKDGYLIKKEKEGRKLSLLAIFSTSTSAR